MNAYCIHFFFWISLSLFCYVYPTLPISFICYLPIWTLSMTGLNVTTNFRCSWTLQWAIRDHEWFASSPLSWTWRLTISWLQSSLQTIRLELSSIWVRRRNHMVLYPFCPVCRHRCNNRLFVSSFSSFTTFHSCHNLAMFLWCWSLTTFQSRQVSFFNGLPSGTSISLMAYVEFSVLVTERTKLVKQIFLSTWYVLRF